MEMKFICLNYVDIYNFSIISLGQNFRNAIALSKRI